MPIPETRLSVRLEMKDDWVSMRPWSEPKDDAAAIANDVMYGLGSGVWTQSIKRATTMAQLETDVAAADLTLGEAVLEGLEEIHRTYTYPCP